MAHSHHFSAALALVAFIAPWALAEDPPSRNLDEVTYEGIIDRSTPIEVEKMLQAA